MPTYDFECGRCGRHQEEVFPMSSMPASVPCACGSAAARVISHNANEVFVKFRPYSFDPTKKVGNNGKAFGRTVEQQHEGYRQHFDGIKKRVKAFNRDGSRSRFEKNGIRYLGGMPGEMADSIGQQEGDPEAVAKDPETWLRKTGMYIGEGE
jgi:putative FmdB family regulatory protein